MKKQRTCGRPRDNIGFEQTWLRHAAQAGRCADFCAECRLPNLSRCTPSRTELCGCRIVSSLKLWAAYLARAVLNFSDI